MNNYESFEVSVSWVENLRENEKIRMAEQEFDDMWNNKCEGLIVMSIPETIRNEIIKFSGDNFVFDESYTNNIFLEDNNILDTKDAAIYHFENNALTLVNTYTNESKLTSNYTFKNFVRSKLSDSIEETINQLVPRAINNNLYGIICSPKDIKSIKENNDTTNIKFVTPGIRTIDSSNDDQKRVVTPKEAISLGSDYLVIGRSITNSDNPLDTYNQIINDL